jgi:threonine aldolase
MRAAMAEAQVGDDVYAEDPTVKALEATAAEMLGKEAGLFVASGTMGNLVAILTHAGRGDEAIVGTDAHTYGHEAGGMAVLGGIMPYPLPTDEIGRLSLTDLAAAIRPDDPHYPASRLILLENSYSSKNGAPIPPPYFALIRDFADEYGLAVHLDGARFFNAAVALNVTPATLARDVDSISVCLSKGLCAPVGSVVCGSAEFIGRARRNRKLLGGGMRQAGVLAAAGLVALRTMVDRLADDHRRASQLAAGLRRIPGIQIKPPEICTNIIHAYLDETINCSAVEMSRRLQTDVDIWIDVTGPRRFRLVTHYWIDDAAVDLLLTAMNTISKKAGGR